MTFKEIIKTSRQYSYDDLASYNIYCLNHRRFSEAFAYNSMMWLNAMNTATTRKVHNWKYAVMAYRYHKNTLTSL